MMVPSHSPTAALRFYQDALRCSTIAAALKLHAQWNDAWTGEAWWGVDAKGNALNAVATIMHARNVLAPWALQQQEAAAEAQKLRDAKAATYRKALRSGAIDDCIIPTWGKRRGGKAGTTMVRFSRG